MATGTVGPSSIASDEARFDEIFAALHRKIEARVKLNYKKERFIPRGEVFDIFRRSEAYIVDLAAITARHSTASHDRQAFENNGKRFYDKITCSIKQGSVGVVLAIVLAVHKTLPFKPSSPAWHKFVSHCLIDSEATKVVCDARLPLKKAQVDLVFDESHAELFYARQLAYSAPVLQRDHDEIQDFTQLEAPLPYLSQNFTREGMHGTVYDTVIERSHIGNADDWAPRNDMTYARKDIKRADKKADVREWTIFQLIKANRDNYDRYVMRIAACIVFEDKVSLFMRKADFDLAVYMSQTPRPHFTHDRQYIQMIANVASALEYFHGKVKDDAGNHITLLHLDVKPENVLVIMADSEAPNPVPKLVLADFGVSKTKQAAPQKSYLSSLFGARVKEVPSDQAATESVLGKIAPCAPPESIEKGLVDEAADVWGFGCVVCIYLAWLCGGQDGVKTFAEERKRSGNQLERFVTKDSDGRLVLNSAVTTELRDRCERIAQLSSGSRYKTVLAQLLRGVMLIDPAERLKMHQVHQTLIDIAKMDPAQFETAYAIIAQSPISMTEASIGDPLPDKRRDSRRHDSVGSTELPASDPQTQELVDNWQAQNGRPSERRMSANVLEYRCTKRDVVAAIMKGDKPSGPPSQLTSYLSWVARPLKEVRAIRSARNGAYLACLHEASVTILKVTDDLEACTRVAISNLGGKSVRTYAMNDRYLCLATDSASFELIFYELTKLAISSLSSIITTTTLEDLWPQYKAYSVTNTRAKVELFASRPAAYQAKEELIACLSPSYSTSNRSLTLLNIDLHKRATTKLSAVARASAVSEFTSAIRSSALSQLRSELTFSADGTAVFWLVQRQRPNQDGAVAHICFWWIESNHRLTPPQQYDITRIGSHSQDKPLKSSVPPRVDSPLIDCLVDPRTPSVLAVYRDSLELHNLKTEDAQPLIIELSQATILAAITEDFECFWLVVDSGPQQVDIVGARRSNSNGQIELMRFWSTTCTSLQWHKGDETPLKALLHNVNGVHKLLLVWSSPVNRSKLVDLSTE